VVNGRSVSDMSPEELGIEEGNRVVTKWVNSPDVVVYPLGDGFTEPEGFESIGADFEGAFELLGVVMVPALSEEVVSLRAPLNLTLYWRVGSAAIETPYPSNPAVLSSFVHVSGEDPSQIVAQYDGWPTAISGLEMGDVIAQPVTMHVTQDAPKADYFVRVGLYSPQSGQRLILVDGGDSAVVDRLFLE